MRKSARSILLASSLALAPLAVSADTVLVTALQGAVSLEIAGATNKAPLEPFVRLREGDKLSLAAGSQLSLVYVGKARLESWQGTGTIVVGESESRAASGKPQSQVRSLPPEVTRQMNRTPTASPDGRVGMMRMRGVPPHDAVARLENDYRQMRSQTTGDDILPEVFLLAGLFDLRQYARVEEELKRIGASFAGNPTAASLQELYSKALSSARTPSADSNEK